MCQQGHRENSEALGQQREIKAPLREKRVGSFQDLETNFGKMLLVYFRMPPRSWVAQGIFRRGADSSDEGDKIWFSGYYKCQKSSKKSLFSLRQGD